jgi:hypothetical protein
MDASLFAAYVMEDTAKEVLEVWGKVHHAAHQKAAA